MLACYGASPPCFPFMFFFGRCRRDGRAWRLEFFFTGAWRPVPLCYFSLLRQRKVTKRKASPARTAVLSGRHVDAGFGAWPPPTLRAWPAPDGARASHERAPALRSVPPAVGLVRVRFAAARVGACGEVPRSILRPLFDITFFAPQSVY